MNDRTTDQRQRQERAGFVNAFSRRVWQPDERPQVVYRMVAGGVALVVVSGAVFGIGAMTSYQHKRSADAERKRNMAMSQNAPPSSHPSSPPPSPFPGPAQPKKAPQPKKVPHRPGPHDSGSAKHDGNTPVPQRDAYSTIEAESYDEKSGVITEAAGGSGRAEVAGARNGDWTLYKSVEFGSSPATLFTAQVASGAGDGVSGLVEVRLDNRSNAPIGNFSLSNTGGWQTYREVSANVRGLSGRHDVYLTFTSGQPADFVNVDSFSFTH